MMKVELISHPSAAGRHKLRRKAKKGSLLLCCLEVRRQKRLNSLAPPCKVLSEVLIMTKHLSHLTFLLLSAVFISLPSHADELVSFDNQSYVQQCGGSIYSMCDTASVNQETIFLEAHSLAQKTNRKLIIDVGADWCHWCVYLNNLMESFPQQKVEFNQKYVLVTLNGDLNSTNKLLAKLGLTLQGFPTFIVYDSKNVKTLGTFTPTSARDIHEILKKADRVGKTDIVQYPWFPTSDIGSDLQKNKIRISMLIKPAKVVLKEIATVDRKFRNSGSIPAAEPFYQQGVFHLLTFNWLEAARSLRQAINLAPDMVSAHLALALAFANLSDMDSAIGNLQAAQTISKKISLTASENLWLENLVLQFTSNSEYRINLGVNTTLNSDQFNSELEVSLNRVTNIGLDEGNLNVVLIVNMGSGDIVTLEKVLIQQPNSVGAHHLLTHSYEGLNKYTLAEKHARRAAQLAPNSAHAQHMYGHILPKMNRWDDAIHQFELADQIHNKWFRSESALPQEDWHYRHNLDLLAYAYDWKHDFDKADASWSKLCDLFEGDYCQTYGLFLITQEKFDKASKAIAKSEKKVTRKLTSQADLWIAVLKEPTNNSLRLKAYNELKNNGDVDMMIRNLLYPDLDATMKQKIVTYVTDSVKNAGFDSWSTGVMAGQVYAKFAEMMGDKALAADIRLAILTVGFVCKSPTNK